jgi:hypothetical protein
MRRGMNGHSEPRRETVPLVIQSAILMVAALVRGNAVTAFGAMALVALVFARHTPGTRRKLATIAITSATVVVLFALTVSPQWLTSGRFQTIVWTRITQSLGMNPSLPIGDLNDMFPCKKYVPGGIPTGIGDQGGGCIWFAHVIEHNIPIDSLWNKTFSGEFEAALRRAFFKIVFKYPRETLETFTYYKPKALMDSIKLSFSFDFSSIPLPYAVFLLGAVVIGLSAAVTASSVGLELTAVLVAALFTTTAYIAAYANPGVMADLFLWCLIAGGLALGGVISAIRLVLGRR